MIAQDKEALWMILQRNGRRGIEEVLDTFNRIDREEEVSYVAYEQKLHDYLHTND